MFELEMLVNELEIQRKELRWCSPHVTDAGERQLSSSFDPKRQCNRVEVPTTWNCLQFTSHKFADLCSSQTVLNPATTSVLLTRSFTFDRDMGGACSSSLASHKETNHRTHRFTSVLDKPNQPGVDSPAANASEAPPAKPTLTPARSKQRRPVGSTPRSFNRERTTASLKNSDPKSILSSAITHQPAMPIRNPLIEAIKAEQALAMSELAGTMMESRTTLASDTLSQSGSSTLTSIGSAAHIGDAPSALLSTMPMPMWKTRQQVYSNNVNNNNNNNNNSCNNPAWDLSLSSTNTPSLMLSPAARCINDNGDAMMDNCMTPPSSSGIA